MGRKLAKRASHVTLTNGRAPGDMTRHNKPRAQAPSGTPNHTNALPTIARCVYGSEGWGFEYLRARRIVAVTGQQSQDAQVLTRDEAATTRHPAREKLPAPSPGPHPGPGEWQRRRSRGPPR